MFHLILYTSFNDSMSPHGGNPHGGQLLLWELTDKLWVLGDLDHSGFLSLAELEKEFITNFDHDGEIS